LPTSIENGAFGAIIEVTLSVAFPVFETCKVRSLGWLTETLSKASVEGDT